MSTDGQGTNRNIAENFDRLSRVHERYKRRRETDGRTDNIRSLIIALPEWLALE